MHPIVEALRSGQDTLLWPQDRRIGAREFVLAHGRAYEPSPLPKGMRRRKPGTCYKACAKEAWRISAMASGLGDIKYVEGFGMTGGLLVAHAWLTRDGEAFDITGRDRRGGAAWGCTYYGVEFQVDAVWRLLGKRGYYGLLDPVDDFVFEALETRVAA